MFQMWTRSRRLGQTSCCRPVQAEAAICAASASLRSRCGSNNLGPCDLFSGYFVVDLPRNVEGLGAEPSGLFGTSFWGEPWNISVSHLRFILVATMVPKCTCSNYNDVDSSSSLLDTN